MPLATPASFERLDVLLGEHLVDELVAQAAGRVAGAGLDRAEHGELHPRGVQQLGDRLGGLLRPVLRAPAQPTQNRYSMSSGIFPSRTGDLEVELGDPVEPLVLGHAPRVAAPLEVVQHAGGLGREGGLDQHLVAAHAVDVVDVLDVDRALLHAGTAVGARPDHVGVDDAVLFRGADQRALRRARTSGARVTRSSSLGQQVRGLRERVVAQVQDELLGRQRLAGRPRAGTATGTGRTRCRCRGRGSPSR